MTALQSTSMQRTCSVQTFFRFACFSAHCHNDLIPFRNICELCTNVEMRSTCDPMLNTWKNSILNENDTPIHVIQVKQFLLFISHLKFEPQHLE